MIPAPVTAPVTATVTAFNRIEQTIDTIARILACAPPPGELLVHVDAARHDTARAIAAAHPAIPIITSEKPVGPGGGRNALAAAARFAIVANFDDDSYPIDADFFARAVALFDLFPDASLFAARIYHPEEVIEPDARTIRPTGSFGGGGVVFRRDHVLATGGYLPLQIAYGAEEEDMALRLIDADRQLFATDWLRVFHDADRSRHGHPAINAAAISNIALLAWLRYPVRYLPYGVAQVLNRARFSIMIGRYRGVLTGLAQIPGRIISARGSRAPVSKRAMIAKHRRRTSGTIAF